MTSATAGPLPGRAGNGARTTYLSRCVDVARTMAHDDGGPVEVHHLFAAAVFNDDRESRSRLVMRQLGAHHFMTDESYDLVAEVFTEAPPPALATRWTPDAEAALGRLAHWASRTGDHTADTAHLLLACAESRPDEIVHAGATLRDIVRAAITVRHRVSPADRPARDRGPILAERRSARPPSFRFTARWKEDAGPSKARHFALRSQAANTAGVSSRVQSHITQLHAAVIMGLTIVNALMVIFVAHAALTGTWWALLWLAALAARRVMVPLTGRVVVDAVLVAVSVVFGLGWLLPALAVFHRVLDVFEGRLGLLELRGETAEPGLSEQDLRADRRVNARAGNFYRLLKLRRELSTR